MPDKNELGFIAKEIGEASFYELIAATASSISFLALETARSIRKENHVNNIVTMGDESMDTDDLKNMLGEEIQEFYAYLLSDKRFVPEDGVIIKHLSSFLKEQTHNNPKKSSVDKILMDSILDATSRILADEKRNNKKFDLSEFMKDKDEPTDRDQSESRSFWETIFKDLFED